MSIVNSRKSEITIQETMKILEKYPSDIEPDSDRNFIYPRKAINYFEFDFEPIHLATLGAMCYYSSYLHEKKYLRSPIILIDSLNYILNGASARKREYYKIKDSINFLSKSPFINIEWIDNESFKFEIELQHGYMRISESEFEKIAMGVSENGIANTHKFIAIYLAINESMFKNSGDISYVCFWKADILSEKTGVSTRTIYRRLKTMGELEYIARYNYLVNSYNLRTKIAISNFHERSVLRRAMQREFEKKDGRVFKLLDTDTEEETI